MGYRYWTELVFGCFADDVAEGPRQRFLNLFSDDFNQELEEDDLIAGQELWWAEADHKLDGVAPFIEGDQDTYGRKAHYAFGWPLSSGKVRMPDDYPTPQKYLDAAETFERVFGMKPKRILVHCQG